MKKCTGCMECEHVCPLTPFGFGIGRIIRKYIEGRDKELINSKEIWQCTMCLACDDACPEDFRPRDVMINLRQMSETYPSVYKRFIVNMKSSGNAFSSKIVNPDYQKLFDNYSG